MHLSALGHIGLDHLAFEVSTSVAIGSLFLLGGYGLAIRSFRRGLTRGRETSRWRVASWVCAVLIMFFALNGPLHEWADGYLLSAHMVQHLLIMLVMPPLLIAGLPPWLIVKALEAPGIYRLGRALTHPAIAFAVYNVVFIFWHVPVMYDGALMDHDLHIVQHLMFMASAVMIWWPVVNPVPELEWIPTGPALMVYLFLLGVPGTVVAAMITLSNDVLYRWYAAAPRITALTPLDDQRLGGLIMWIPGMLIFWIAITFVFFRWTKDEYLSWKIDPEAPSPL